MNSDRVNLKLALVLAVAVTFTAAVQPLSAQTSQQSPVDVRPGAIRFDPKEPKLDVSYGRSELELKYIRKDTGNSGGCEVRHHEETEEAEVEPGSAHVTVAGVRYDLVQFHFHTPSEHSFAGRSYPLEMHLVHRSAAGKLLVVGVPLRAGSRSAVDQVLAKLAPECGEPVHVPEIDLNRLLPQVRRTLHYNGSLTTAPFTEGVEWYLTSELTVSQATISRFQHLFTEGNSRATQPLNGRTFKVVPRI